MRTEDIINDIAEAQGMKPTEADISNVRTQVENDYISDVLRQSINKDTDNEIK